MIDWHHCLDHWEWRVGDRNEDSLSRSLLCRGMNKEYCDTDFMANPFEVCNEDDYLFLPFEMEYCIFYWKLHLRHNRIVSDNSSDEVDVDLISCHELALFFQLSPFLTSAAAAKHNDPLKFCHLSSEKFSSSIPLNKYQQALFFDIPTERLLLSLTGRNSLKKRSQQLWKLRERMDSGGHLKFQNCRAQRSLDHFCGIHFRSVSDNCNRHICPWHFKVFKIMECVHCSCDLQQWIALIHVYNLCFIISRVDLMQFYPVCH